MKLKIQIGPIESIQMGPIESIQMKLKTLGNFWAFLLIVRVLLIKCFQVNQNAQYYCYLIFLEQFWCFGNDSI